MEFVCKRLQGRGKYLFLYGVTGVRPSGFEGLFFIVGEGGEEVEAGTVLHFIDGGKEVREWFRYAVGVGEDGGEHGVLAIAVDEDRFEEVGGDGDLIDADGFGLGGFEEGAGDDGDGV